MQFISYTRWDNNLYCPVTGRPVLAPDGTPNTPTLKGYWVDEIMDEPVFTDEGLEAAWTAYLEANTNEDGEVDIVDLPEFLQQLDRPGWLAMEVTMCGMACGPVSNTMWAVLDLEAEVDDE